MGPSSFEAGEVISDLGELYTTEGQPTKGPRFYERARSIIEQALGSEHREVGEALSGLGQSYLDLHRADLAVPVLERALRLRTDETPSRMAPLWFALARALWEVGSDRPRAVALASQAAAPALRPGDGVTHDDIAAWLAVHTPR